MVEPGTTALIQAPGEDGRPGWWRFGRPRAVLAAARLEEVLPVLAEIEREVAAGAHAVGLLAYEAAPAFDPALSAHPPSSFPLAWWGLFDPPAVIDLEAALESAPAPRLDWRPLVSQDEHRRAVERIRELIAAGETYQVNYTFPLETGFAGEPLELFLALCQAQRAGCCGYLDLGRFAICSASPELFFELDGERVVCRPMKGTAPRAPGLAQDLERASGLAASEKNCAENVMIVDMVRNDLGKVALPGSVMTERLLEVETYPTVHQLTSTVSARTRAPLTEILRALFPCASITGAPKVRATRFIRELEPHPRGVYTGTLGWVAPGRRIRFNVAIRTVTVDREAALARYGVGGGIVWDSDPAAEYQECRTKALVLTAAPPVFELLETLLWRPRRGFFLLDRHLDRLLGSAGYFGFEVAREDVIAALSEAAAGFEPVRQRVRLLADRHGRVRVEAKPFPCDGRRVWKVALCRRPIDPADPFLWHKTTWRRTYEKARAKHPGCDDVILVNPAGELTELTVGNLVLQRDGRHLTPPAASGLLPGTYRAELLARGRIEEARLFPRDLARGEAVFLISSVRGWVRLVVEAGGGEIG